MTKEDLMKPRFKVIAGYPNAHTEVGRTLVRVKNATNDYYHTDENAYVGGILLSEIKKYPHLFRELRWDENRKISEMPEYIFWSLSTKKVVAKVKEWTKGYSGMHCAIYGDDTSLYFVSECSLLPATESDYITYQKSLK